MGRHHIMNLAQVIATLQALRHQHGGEILVGSFDCDRGWYFAVSEITVCDNPDHLELHYEGETALGERFVGIL